MDLITSGTSMRCLHRVCGRGLCPARSPTPPPPALAGPYRPVGTTQQQAALLMPVGTLFFIQALLLLQKMTLFISCELLISRLTSLLLHVVIILSSPFKAGIFIVYLFKRIFYSVLMASSHDRAQTSSAVVARQHTFCLCCSVPPLTEQTSCYHSRAEVLPCCTWSWLSCAEIKRLNKAAWTEQHDTNEWQIICVFFFVCFFVLFGWDEGVLTNQTAIAGKTLQHLHLIFCLIWIL